MKTTLLRKVVASILSVLMTFYSMELAGVIAAYASQEKDQINLLECVPKDAEKRYEHVKHLDQYDTENMVAYLNQNGASTFYIFQSPIRYKDKDGKLIDYDNTLVSVKDSRTLGEGYKYKNKSSDIEVLFPEHLQGAEGVKIKKDDYSVEIIPVPLFEKEPTPTPEPTVEPVSEATVAAVVTPTLEHTASPEPTENPMPTVEITPEPIIENTPTSDPATEATQTLETIDNPEISDVPENTDTITPSPEPTATPLSEATATPTVAPTATPEITSVPTATASPEQALTPEATAAPEITPTPEPPKEKDKVWGYYEPKTEVESKYKAKIKDDEKGSKDKKAKYESSENGAIEYSYSALNNGIKEDIVLGSYTGQNVFDFVIIAPGLELTVNEYNIIEFKDSKTDELIFVSNEPFATDSYNGAEDNWEDHYCEDIRIKIISGKNDEHRIRIEVPTEFLEAPTTVYPVTIDPSVVLNSNGPDIYDTFINYALPDTNWNTNPSMYIGGHIDSTYSVCWGLMKADVSDFTDLGVPANNITSTTLSLHTKYSYTSNLSLSYYLRAYRLLHECNPSTVTWNTFIASQNVDWQWNGYEYSITSDNAWYSLNITEMMKNWAKYAQDSQTGYPNYGLLLREKDDTTGRMRKFGSVDSTSGYDAYITIQYDADLQVPQAVTNIGIAAPGFEEDTINPGRCKATVVWDPAIDNPSGEYSNSGIKDYLLYYSNDGINYQAYDSIWIDHDDQTAQYEKEISNLVGGQEYTFKVVARDNDLNTQTIAEAGQSSTYTVSDYHPPAPPAIMNILPDFWTNDESPTISWSTVEKDSPSEIITYQYSIDDPSGTWNDITSISLPDETSTSLLPNPHFSSGTTSWSPFFSSLNSSSNIMTITSNGSQPDAIAGSATSHELVVGNKIYVKFRARVTNSNCNSITAYLTPSTRYTPIAGFGDIMNPIANEWYDASFIFTPTSGSGEYARLMIMHRYTDAATANGKVMQVDGTAEKGVFMIDLTEVYGAGNEPDIEICDLIYGSLVYKEVDLSSENLEAGIHNIYIRAKDDSNNAGEANSVEYKLDNSPPISVIYSPINGSTNYGLVNVQGTVNDTFGFDGWELRYAEGDTEDISLFTDDNILASDIENEELHMISEASSILPNPHFSSGTTSWSPFFSSLNSSSNIMTITSNGSQPDAIAGSATSHELVVGNKIYVKFRARVTNSNCNSITAYLTPSTRYTPIAGFGDIMNPIANEWYDASFIFTPTSGSGEYARLMIMHRYTDAATANGKVMQVDGTAEKGVFMIDLTEMFGAGNEPDLATCNEVFDGYTFNPTSIIENSLYEWDMDETGLEEGEYTLWLRSYDKAGNTADDFVKIFKSEIAESVDAQLVLTEPDPTQAPVEINSNQYTVSYTRNGGDAVGLENSELYVNGELVDSDASDGLSLDIINGDYEEGESYYVFVKADDDGETKYSTISYNVVLKDNFLNGDAQLTIPLDQNIELSTGKITLAQDGGYYPLDSYSVVESNFTGLVYGRYVNKVKLVVGENKPAGTSITYMVSNDGITFISIVPGAEVSFPTTGGQLIVRATLNTTDSSKTPEITGWQAIVTQVSQGTEVIVKLIEAPTNISVVPQINYKTLIRWEDAQNPEGTTYNVYRYPLNGGTASTPDGGGYNLETVTNLPDAYTYEAEDGEVIAEGLEEMFFYDYNLNYNKLYSYKVSAVVNVGTTEDPVYRESVLSNYAIAAMIDEDELDKRLGLQDYWKYTGFVTGSGSGQIELSQGNLSYQTTDFVFPGPMFAMVMRRTYNSQSTSKTAMGYGTDFSFNTALLMEYNASDAEVGAILKDGDGSIHRFAKNGSIYDSPIGVFMELTHENEGLENELWRISRKDGIDYIFDKNMLLIRFEDRNGNYLEYSYDTKGNISTVTDNAGNSIMLAYTVNDLLDTITVEGPDPSVSTDERVYEYSYITDATGKTRLSHRELDGVLYFDEDFGYNASTGKLQTIIDGEDHEYTVYYTTNEDTISMIEYSVDSTSTEYFSIAYDETNSETTVSFNGNDTEYVYDASGCVTSITNALDVTTSYSYNTNLQVTGITYNNIVEDGTSEETISTSVTYDVHDNISTVTDDEGNVITYNYIDPDNQVTYNEFDSPYTMTMTSATYGEGSVTTNYTYDIYGNVLTTTDPENGTVTNTYYSGEWNSSNKGYPGQLHTTTDRYGNVTRYEYTAEGWLSKITDDNSEDTLYAYDGMGNPIYITDAMGNITKTEYDLIGRKTKIYYPDGDSDFTDGTNDTESWIYNNNGNVTYHYAGTGGDQVVTRYTYDYMNRLTHTYHNTDPAAEATVYYEYIETSSGSGAYTLKVSYTDREGIESIEYYDALGRLSKTKTANGAQSTNITTYTYDNVGNMIEVADGEGRVVQAQYDSLNRTTKTIVDPGSGNLNLTSEYEYDYLGRTKKTIDGEGAETDYTYDDLSRLLMVTQSPDGDAARSINYEASLDLSSEGIPDMRTGVFSADGTSFYLVDDVNKAVKQIDLTTAWDISTGTYTSGNCFDVSAQIIGSRAMEFSADGTKMYIGCCANDKIFMYNLSTPWVVSTAAYANVSLDISAYAPTIKSMTFDPTGTILLISDHPGKDVDRFDLSTAWDITTASYANKTGDLSAQITVGIKSFAIKSNGLEGWALDNELDNIYEYTLSTAWDPSTISYTGRSYNITNEVLSNNGGMVCGNDESLCVISSGDASLHQYMICDLEKYCTTYTYDTVSGDYIISEIEDAEGGITQTWFDNMGRVYKEINDGTDDTDSLIIESVYHYDAIGRMTYKTFEDGTILGYTYDVKGHLWKEKYYDSYSDYSAEDNDESTVTYTDYTFYEYDSRGNLTGTEGELDNEEFEHTWVYDTRNQVTQQTENITVDGGSTVQNAVSYDYWDNRQLKSITYPAAYGDTVNTVQQKYSYNSFGQLSEIMLGNNESRVYTYDASGMVIQTDTYIDVTDAGDVMSAYFTYNDAGLTTDIQYRFNGVLKERYQYGYDNNGMITSETITPYGVSTNVSKTHVYDDIGRLTQTTIDGTTTTYTYDNVGNRLTASDGTDSKTYIYDALYQLQEINKNSNKEFEYDYDGLGRQTAQREYKSSNTLIEAQTFTYHDSGMLKNVLIEDSDGTDEDINETYLYNGQGQRIIKTFVQDTTTSVTKYLYSGSAVIMTADSASIKITENILTPSGQIISSQRFDVNGDSTGWYSYNYDIRSSTTAIVNSAGVVQNSYEYDAFGDTVESGSLLNEVAFTGAISDGTTGLYYMNARYYNSDTGRFISRDSYKGSAYEPWTQNLYSYVGNNPVNMVDPTGHFAITAAILLIAAIGTVIATSPDLEMDLWDLSNDLSCGNYGWAAFDAAMIILPAVPASTVKPVINTVAETSKPWLDDVGKFFSKTWDDIGGWFKKSDDAIDTVDDTIKKSIDFFITPQGEAIPGGIDDLYDNLSKMDEVSNSSSRTKYRGTDSTGDIQVRVEAGHYDDPGYTGPRTTDHIVSHFHIDRRINITSGGFDRCTFTAPMRMWK